MAPRQAVNDWQTVDANDWQDASVASSTTPIPANIQQMMAVSHASTLPFAQQHPNVAKAADIGSSVLQGLGTIPLGYAYRTAQALNAIPGIGETLAPSEGLPGLKQMATPQNLPEKIGAGTGQAAEMALIGGPARSLATRLGLGAMGRIGAATGVGAASSFAHQQDPAAGGLITGLTEGGGELAKVLAPKLAEAALGTRYSERMYGRNPGAAIIENTKGVSPDAIAKSAKEVSLGITSNLEQSAVAASQRGVTVSTQPALNVIDKAIQTATKENNSGLVAQLQEARSQLTQRFDTKAAIPTKISPSELLDLKRGFGDTITNWGRIPDRQGVSGVLKQAYHALDGEFDKAVPEAAKNNQIVSTLIGVSKDAERRAVQPDLVQRVVQRARAHTGALIGSTFGGYEGYKHGGTLGGIGGAIGGAVIPEVMASPGSVMLAARAANAAQPAMTAAVPAFIQQMMQKSH